MANVATPCITVLLTIDTKTAIPTKANITAAVAPNPASILSQLDNTISPRYLDATTINIAVPANAIIFHKESIAFVSVIHFAARAEIPITDIITTIVAANPIKPPSISLPVSPFINIAPKPNNAPVIINIPTVKNIISLSAFAPKSLTHFAARAVIPTTARVTSITAVNAINPPSTYFPVLTFINIAPKPNNTAVNNTIPPIKNIMSLSALLPISFTILDAFPVIAITAIVTSITPAKAMRPPSTIFPVLPNIKSAPIPKHIPTSKDAFIINPITESNDLVYSCIFLESASLKNEPNDVISFNNPANAINTGTLNIIPTKAIGARTTALDIFFIIA